MSELQNDIADIYFDTKQGFKNVNKMIQNKIEINQTKPTDLKKEICA